MVMRRREMGLRIRRMVMVRVVRGPVRVRQGVALEFGKGNRIIRPFRGSEEPRTCKSIYRRSPPLHSHHVSNI